jgi:hypothetical protein
MGNVGSNAFAFSFNFAFVIPVYIMYLFAVLQFQQVFFLCQLFALHVEVKVVFLYSFTLHLYFYDTSRDFHQELCMSVCLYFVIVQFFVLVMASLDSDVAVYRAKR